MRMRDGPIALLADERRKGAGGASVREEGKEQHAMQKKASRCTMKVVVLKLKDMIGVVGRLRTKHD